jgi:uncharacterized protein
MVLDCIWPRAGFGRAWSYRMKRMARMQVSEHKIALGFSAGALASFTPLIGFHFVLAAAIALIVRGNLIASAVGTVVGNPLTFPIIWLSTYHVGCGLIGAAGAGGSDAMDGSAASQVILGSLSSPEIWTAIQPVILPMLAGAVPLGFVCAIICYVLVFASLRRIRGRYRRLSALPVSAHDLPAS